MLPQLLDALNGLKGHDAWTQSKLGAVLRHRLLTAANVEDVAAKLQRAGSHLPGQERKQKAALIAERLRNFYSEDKEPASSPALQQLDQYLSLGTSGRVIAQARFPFASTDPNAASLIGVWQVVSVGEGNGEVEYSLIGSHPNGPTGVSHPLLDPKLSSGFKRAVAAAKAEAGSLANQNLVVGLHFEAIQGQCDFPADEHMGGPSGSLALFIALLCAWHKLPVSTTDDLLFTANVLDTGEVGPVGYQIEKFRALRDSARFRKFFHCLNAGALDPELERVSVPLKGALSNVWSQVQADQQHLRDWVRSQIRQFDEEIGDSGRRPSDYDELKIRIVKTEMVPDKSARADQSQADVSDSDNKINLVPALPADPEAPLEAGVGARQRVLLGFKEQPSNIIGLDGFEQEVLKTSYGKAVQPPIVVGAPGIGKSFSTRSLVRRVLSRWLDDPTSEIFAVWVNLPSLPKDWVPDHSPAGAMAAALKLEGDQRDQLVHAIKTKKLLLVLDAFDQASAYHQELEVHDPDQPDKPAKVGRLAAFLKSLQEERAHGAHLYPLIMSRPVTQWTLRRQFPTVHAAEVKYQQAEFSPNIVKHFLKIRLEDDVLTERVLSIRQHTGQDLLGVPILLEILSELAVSGQLADGGRWKDDGSVVVRWNTYDKIIKHRLAKAAKSLVTKGNLDSAETGVVEDCFDVLSLLSVHLWDYDPGRNLFTLAEWREKLGSACRTLGFSRTTAEQVLREAGLFELGVRGNEIGEEVADDWEKAGHSWGNAIHRTILEYMRSAELQSQLMTALEVTDDWDKVWSWKKSQTERFRYSLDLIIDRKSWDEQWAEVLVFWAGRLADFDGQRGTWLVPFLERIEGVRRPRELKVGCLLPWGSGGLLREPHDCLLRSRLNLALRCLRQTWFLYQLGSGKPQSTLLVAWCKNKRRQLLRMRGRHLVNWSLAAWYSSVGLTDSFYGLLLSCVDSIEPASANRQIINFLISRLETEKHWHVLASLSKAIGLWSSHVSTDILDRLTSRLEGEQDRTVRWCLSNAIRHGSEAHADRSISRLDTEEARIARASRFNEIGLRSLDENSAHIDRLISQLASAENWTKIAVSEAIGLHGSPVQLDRLMARLDTEQDWTVLSSLSEAIGLWSLHGSPAHLDRLTSRLEAEQDWTVRRYLSDAIGLWFSHGSSAHIDRLISLLEIEKDWYVRYSLSRAIGLLSSFGRSAHLDRLISCLEAEDNLKVRRSQIEAIGLWSTHADSVLLERMILMISQRKFQELVNPILETIKRWQIGPNGSRRFLPSGATFIVANPIALPVLVNHLADLDRP